MKSIFDGSGRAAEGGFRNWDPSHHFAAAQQFVRLLSEADFNIYRASVRASHIQILGSPPLSALGISLKSWQALSMR
jgi:hypothetical protein